jgi:putative oxidoreductase
MGDRPRLTHVKRARLREERERMRERFAPACTFADGAAILEPRSTAAQAVACVARRIRCRFEIFRNSAAEEPIMQTFVTPSADTLSRKAAAMAPYALALLRLVTAFLFIQHATAKFFHMPHVAQLDGVQVMSLFGIAGIIELVGSTLLLLGLFTRATAFVLSGEMAVAYFMVHAPQGHALSPLLNGGESAVLFCFIFLALAAVGGGAWALDGRRR